MNTIRLIRTLLLGFVIMLLSAILARAEHDFSKHPELDQVYADMIGDFDPDTATVEDCRVQLSEVQKAISEGTFERSNDYLSRIYVMQGMLLACVSQDPVISDTESMEMINAAFSNLTSAQSLAPDWEVPYFLLGNYHKVIGKLNKSIEDYRKAESYFIKVLELDPGNSLGQSELDEVRQLIPVKRAPGFKPIPFE